MALAFMMSSCSIQMTGASAAYDAGQRAANAVAVLYSAYSNRGKFDASSVSDYSNMIILIQAGEELKQHANDQDFINTFIDGIAHVGTRVNNPASVVALINTISGCKGLDVNAANLSYSAGFVNALTNFYHSVNAEK